MTHDHVFKSQDGWSCIVDGRVFGAWPCKEYAAAGLKTEQDRASKRTPKCEGCGSPRPFEQIKWCDECLIKFA
jgi:hypothetical protein